MAQYLVIVKSPGQDVPALGQTGQAVIYRGDHPSEGEAVNAAAAILKAGDGARLWATLASNLTRYVQSEAHTYTAAPG